MPLKTTSKPQRVPRCPDPAHKYFTAGCADCRRYSAYIARRLRWERRTGIAQPQIPATVVAEHLNMLINEGNWVTSDLARVSGICEGTIHLIRTGIRQVILPITADTLLTIQPREEPRPLQMNLVPALEVARLARGMAAQGWSIRHIAQLMGLSRNAVQRLSHVQDWVQAGTVPPVRAVAAKLRPYDIAQLPKPLPGMDIRAANNARRKGWVPLIAWYGQDMADPTAVPWRIRPTGSPLIVPVVRPVGRIDQDDDLPEVSPWSYVDPILTLRVAEAAKTVRDTTTESGRRAHGFINPITHLTRIAAHVVAECATTAGLSATDTARLLGYSQASRKEVDNGARAVERMKKAIREARQLLDRLAAGERVDPAWCFRQPGNNGINDFTAVATAVLAVQPAPFGPGWSPAELADRAGVGEEQMREFLTYATRRGDAQWKTDGQARRSDDCSRLAPEVEPVDLAAVLAAT